MSKTICDERRSQTLIGRGAQYSVYDIGDSRVLKVLNSLDESIAFFRHREAEEENAVADGTQVRDTAIRSVPHILRLSARYPILSDALGCPRAAPALGYTQEKVLPLSDVFEKATPEEMCRLIDGFIDCYLLCWQYGVYDYLMNLLGNNGLDANGRVVQIDFGECALRTSTVSDAVFSPDWGFNSHHLGPHVPDDINEYFVRNLNQRATVDSFRALWGRGLNSLDRTVISGPYGFCERSDDDMVALVEQLVERAARESAIPIRGVAPKVMDSFRTFDARVFELDTLIHESVARCKTEIMQPEDLRPHI